MSDRDKQKKKHNHWPLRVFFMAVVLSALLSFFSSTALEGTGYAVALAVLAAFIALGIVFDMVGVAVTAADPRPFHSMAAHKEKGGKEAIRLLKNANQVSSFCNDVVGDICGIVSGSTAAVIAAARSQHALGAAVHRHHGADLRHHDWGQGARQDRGHQRLHERRLPRGPRDAYFTSFPLNGVRLI